jgi:hypothetical protein
MKKLLLTAFGCATVLAGATSANAQSTIAKWTFENLSVATNTNPTPSTDLNGAVTSVSTLGMTSYNSPGLGTNAPDIVLGKSSDTGVNNVADLTNTWRVRATGAGNGWSSAAPLEAQGAQFNVDTTGFDNITVSFDWYTTTQGEANLELEYTTDGTDWINAPITLGGSDSGATVETNSSNANLITGSYVNSDAQNWYTGLTATLPITGDSSFGIRMVNAATGTADVSTADTALNNSSGNWRFDNVSISGQAVPEPSTYGTVALGAALLMFGSRRIRRFRRA